MSRTIAIGDVHGCSNELIALLDKLEVQADDHIVFLGDLINRGPDSHGVLNIVHNLSCKCTFIMGNHELRLLKCHQTGDDSRLKPYDLKTIEQLRPEDWDLIESMVPTYYSKEFDTVFVHGGFLPSEPWDEQPLNTVSRIQVIDQFGKPRKRNKYPDAPYWHDLWHGPPFVIYGHIPREEVERTTWTLGLDTSCVWGGKLTAYILPERAFVDVPAEKAYVTKERTP